MQITYYADHRCRTKKRGSRCIEQARWHPHTSSKWMGLQDWWGLVKPSRDDPTMLIKHFLSLFLLNKVTRFGWKIWVTRSNFRVKLLKNWHCLTDSSFLAFQELPSFLIVPSQSRDSLWSCMLTECWQLFATVLLLLTPSLDCQTDQLPANHDIPGKILHICEVPLILSHQGSQAFMLISAS